jgi:hypothetical protein
VTQAAQAGPSGKVAGDIGMSERLHRQWKSEVRLFFESLTSILATTQNHVHAGIFQQLVDRADATLPESFGVGRRHVLRVAAGADFVQAIEAWDDLTVFYEVTSRASR